MIIKSNIYAIFGLFLFFIGCGGGGSGTEGGGGISSITPVSVGGEKSSQDQTVSLLLYGAYGESLGEIKDVSLKADGSLTHVDIKSNAQFVVVKNNKEENIAFQAITEVKNIMVNSASQKALTDIQQCADISKEGIDIKSGDKSLADENIKKICLLIAENSNFIKIPKENISVSSEVSGQNVTVKDTGMSTSEIKQLLSKIHPLQHYYFKIISQPFRIKADPVASKDKNISVAIKIPDSFLDRHNLKDLSLFIIGTNPLHSPQNGHEEVSLHKLETNQDTESNTLTGEQNTTFFSGNALVVIGSSEYLKDGNSRKLRSVDIYHPDNFSKPLASLLFYFEPDDPEFLSIFSEYLIKIWDFYQNKIGFNLKRIHTPIQIGIMDFSPDAFAITDPNSSEILFFIQSILNDDKVKSNQDNQLEFYPYKGISILAHELFHYISLFYIDSIAWDGFGSIEESAATYFQLQAFSGDYNPLNRNVKQEGVINASIDDLYDISSSNPLCDDENKRRSCNIKEVKRADKVYGHDLDGITDDGDSVPLFLRTYDYYTVYSRLFNWASSLNPNFVKELYEELDQSTRLETLSDGTIKRNFTHLKPRKIIEQKIQSLLKKPMRAIAPTVQGRIDQHYTALFIEPDQPLLEFYANYLLLFHHPKDPNHPTSYYPHFPDLMGGNVPDDVFLGDDFYTYNADRNASAGGSIRAIHDVSIQAQIEGKQGDVQGVFNQWIEIPADYVSPKNPFTARLLRIYMDPNSQGSGKVILNIEKKSNLRYQKTGMLIFKEIDPTKELEFVLSSRFDLFDAHDPYELDYECTNSCPNFYVLIVNGNFDFREYDPLNQGRDLYEVENNEEVFHFLDTLPEFSVNIKAIPNKETFPDQTISCKDHWFGASYVIRDESTFRRLDPTHYKVWYPQTISKSVGSYTYENSNYTLLPDSAYSLDGRAMRILLPNPQYTNAQLGDVSEMLQGKSNFEIKVDLKQEIKIPQDNFEYTETPRHVIQENSRGFTKFDVVSEENLGLFSITGSLPYTAKEEPPNSNYVTYIKKDGCEPPANIEIKYVTFQPTQSKTEKVVKGSDLSFSDTKSDFIYFDVITNVNSNLGVQIGTVILRSKDLATNEEETYTNNMENERYNELVSTAIGVPKIFIKPNHEYELTIQDASFKYVVEQRVAGDDISGYKNIDGWYTVVGSADCNRTTMPEYCREMKLPQPYSFKFRTAPEGSFGEVWHPPSQK